VPVNSDGSLDLSFAAMERAPARRSWTQIRFDSEADPRALTKGGAENLCSRLILARLMPWSSTRDMGPGKPTGHALASAQPGFWHNSLRCMSPDLALSVSAQALRCRA
jgi:hypothetical protein